MRRATLFAVLTAGACNVVAHAATGIPFKRDAEASALSGSGGMAVVLVSLLAIGAVYIVRKRLKLGVNGHGAPALLRVLETRRLGPRALLSVVEFGGKRHLIAQSEHGISCIDTVVLADSTAIGEQGDAD